MRRKNQELIKGIQEFVDRYYREHQSAPSAQAVGDALGVSKQTAYRYLLELSRQGMLEYDGGVKSSPRIAKCRTGYISVPVVGSIRCGDPEAEEEQVEEYVNLPESIFGKGKFYLVRAKGDSMTDAGIDDDDLILVEQTHEARPGDIVVALDAKGENTLKLFDGRDEKTGAYRLAYMNLASYPGKVILVESFTVQGIARNVIKTL